VSGEKGRYTDILQQMWNSASICTLLDAVKEERSSMGVSQGDAEAAAVWLVPAIWDVPDF
jgi:hypothetical protein